MTTKNKQAITEQLSNAVGRALQRSCAEKPLSSTEGRSVEAQRESAVDLKRRALDRWENEGGAAES